MFGDGFLGAPLDPKDASPSWREPKCQSGSRASAFDSNSSARSRSPLGSPETPSAAGNQNLIPNTIRARTLLGSMASACSQSAYAASASLPIDPAFHCARGALESQVLGVAIGRGRPFDACALGIDELKVECVRQMRDDRVLRLQQIGAGRVELFGPEVSAAAGVDELGVDPHPIAARLHRAFENIAHAQILADRLGVDRLALEGHGLRGKVLVADNGIYCERVARTLSMLTGAEVRTCSFGLGAPLDLGVIEESLVDHRPDWLAIVHHETSTGILNPLAAVAQLCRRYGARLFVDAVSSVGVHDVDRRADVLCFNSSKCLESLPGVAGVLWRSDLAAYPTVPVLDATAYAEGMPSTPNVQAMIALDTALDIVESEDRPARYRRLAAAVWEAGSRHFDPLLEERHRSWVLTSFQLGGRDADALFNKALAHGYVIYYGQRELRDEIFRVANMGAAIDEETIRDLFEVLST